MIWQDFFFNKPIASSYKSSSVWKNQGIFEDETGSFKTDISFKLLNLAELSYLGVS